TYDADNRKTAETDPQNHTATFAYNGNGLLRSTTDRLGRRRDFGYDAADRVVTEVWHDAGEATVNTLTHTYDGQGNELSAADKNGTYTMAYDAEDRVTSVRGPFGTA